MPTRTALAVALALLAAPVVPATADAASLALVGQWGAKGTAAGQFDIPTDVAVAPDGTIYTLENGNDRVQRFDPAGGRLGGWGSTGSAAGQFAQPEALTVAPNGEVSVADGFNDNVQRFTATGTLTLRWGASGSGPGQFRAPEGIVAAGAGTVYIGDRANSQVDQYTVTTGASFQRSWGTLGSGPGQFMRPRELALDGAGNVYVVDRDNARVQKFSPTGSFLSSFGTKGSGPGQLAQPSDVAIDSGGNVWVADVTNFKLVKFSPDARVLADYDQAGTQGFRPEAVAVAPNGDLYVADVSPTTGPRILRLREAAGPPPSLSSPVLGRTANVARVKGTVLVGIPAGKSAGRARAAQVKGIKFVPLAQARQIPVGSFLDTRKGSVRLTTAKNTAGATQRGDFSGGLFQVLQSRSKRSKGLAELRLKGSSFRACRSRGGGSGAGPAGRAAARTALSRRVIRRVRGKARGRFRTRGRRSAATVRGTDWTVTDRCDGTLTTVKRGKVVVRDFRRRKNVTVRAGRRYLARAPR